MTDQMFGLLFIGGTIVLSLSMYVAVEVLRGFIRRRRRPTVGRRLERYGRNGR